MKKAATAIVALITLAVFSASVAAQQPVEYTVTVRGDVVKGSTNDHFLTFSAPVQIPEVTLPAGTYIFSIVAPSVVQVSNADRSQYYAMFFTAPVQRDEARDHYEMVLVRTEETSPRRISKWFVPNRSVGFEFLFPMNDLPGER